MGNRTGTMPLPVPVTAPRPVKLTQRLFTIGYVVAVTIAMVGWCAALGSAAISAVKWMVS